MEMPAVCLSHLRVRLRLVLNHRASQREVGRAIAPPTHTQNAEA